MAEGDKPDGSGRPELRDGVIPFDVLGSVCGTVREAALSKHSKTREVAKTLGLSQPSVVRKLRRGKKH